MNNARRVIAVITAVSLIAGCVTLPELDQSKIPTTGDTVLNVISTRQSTYSHLIGENGKYNQTYNILMITAGVVSVAAAVFSHGAAKGNIIAGAGIAAGALALGYSPSDRSARAQALLTGIHQLSCLRSRIVASQFTTTLSESQFNDQVTALQAALNVAENVIKQHVSSDAGYNALNSAISVANTTNATAQGELNAFAQLNDISVDTFFSIDSQVAIALQGNLLSYSDVVSAMTPKPAPEAPAPTAPNANTTKTGQPLHAAVLPTIPVATSDLLAAVDAVTNNPVMAGKLYSTAAIQIPLCATTK